MPGIGPARLAAIRAAVPYRRPAGGPEEAEVVTFLLGLHPAAEEPA